jgi:hypothetical protein
MLVVFYWTKYLTAMVTTSIIWALSYPLSPLHVFSFTITGYKNPMCQSFFSAQYEANHMHKAWDMLNIVEVVYYSIVLEWYL